MPLAFVLVLLGLLALAFFLSLWRMRRALAVVVRRFRETGAVSPDHAKTVEDLGITPQTFMERLYQMRDYRPYALQLLQAEEVVREVSGGRLYLSEQKLAQSRFHELARQ